jgi:putative membrane protein
MPVLFAFLHHLAAFALVSALAIESAMTRGELTFDRARVFLSADRILGIAAGVLLVVGMLRVGFFEKGSAYYMHSAPFIAKFSLFVIVGLLSIYPTVQALSWRSALKAGTAPSVPPEAMRRLRLMIRLETMGVGLIILCAAMMAKGVGALG